MLEESAEAFFASDGVGRNGAGPFRRLSAGQRPVVVLLVRPQFVVIGDVGGAEQRGQGSIL